MDPISSRFADAFACARHRQQVRKGTDIPYVSHLMLVSGLVLEAGGDEEQAIAGLLHDAIEDAPPGEADQVRKEVRERFGDRVLAIIGVLGLIWTIQLAASVVALRVLRCKPRVRESSK